jgi:hypothetical protein
MPGGRQYREPAAGIGPMPIALRKENRRQSGRLTAEIKMTTEGVSLRTRQHKLPPLKVLSVGNLSPSAHSQGRRVRLNPVQPRESLSCGVKEKSGHGLADPHCGRQPQITETPLAVFGSGLARRGALMSVGRRFWLILGNGVSSALPNPVGFFARARTENREKKRAPPRETAEGPPIR